MGIIIIGIIIIGIIIFVFIVKSNKSKKPKKSSYTKPTLTVEIKNDFSNDLKYTSESHSKSKTKWLGKEALKIGNYSIENTMTYISSSKHTVEYPACILKKEKIGVEIDEEKGALGYWPSYKEITPDQRANYLAWMASGRTSELKDVGYIFIFFYGLENRLLVEGKDKEIILEEVKRLLKLYGHMSGSLRGYLGDFLLYNSIEENLEDLNLETIESFGEYAHQEKINAIRLAWYYIKNKPIPAGEVINIVRNHSDSKRSVVTTRIPETLEKLFTLKYNQKYPTGVALKVAKREYQFNYHVANRYLDTKPIKIPNVLGINSQFKYCINIWNQSIEDLKQLSAIVGKGNSVDSAIAYTVLPDLLKKITKHPLSSKFDSIISNGENIESYRIIEISDIVLLINIEKKEKLTLTQSRNISNLCRDLKFNLEPDSNITEKPYKLNDKVALFKVDGDENTANYKILSLILQIGIVVANSDGDIDNEEVEHIINFLEDTFMLTENEKRRTNALKNILIKQPPSINGLGKKIKTSLDDRKIKMISKFIVGISAIDGEISKDEIKTLKTLFKAMGLDSELLESFIKELQPVKDEPVEIISKSKNIKTGESIPQIEKIEEKQDSIELDHNRINSILSNTKEISNILGEIFTEEEEEIENSKVIEITEESLEKANDTLNYNGLDNRYHNLLNELLKKTEWDIKHFEDLTRKYNQMPLGVLDAINEWSDEFLDDFLIIEEGNKIIIEKDLFEGM